MLHALPALLVVLRDLIYLTSRVCTQPQIGAGRKLGQVRPLPEPIEYSTYNIHGHVEMSLFLAIRSQLCGMRAAGGTEMEALTLGD